MMQTASVRASAETALQAQKRQRSCSETLTIGVTLYVSFGLVFIHQVGYDLLEFFLRFPDAVATFASMAQLMVPWWAMVVLVVAAVAIGPVRRRLITRAPQILSSILLCGAFTVMFGLIKNGLPVVVPFWADAFLSKADEVLHMGYSPHDLLAFMAPLNTNSLLIFYFNGWVFFATFFPVLLIAFDDDAARRRAFLILWMLCWIGLGNVLAAVFMSYGPIFTDLFFDGLADAHFGPLALLDRADASALMWVKTNLWHSYTGESDMLGSGISAFPSVHVGMATVLGLYIARLGADFGRSQRFGPLMARWFVWACRLAALLYVTVYMVLSVWLGWHYALDGYASILLMVLAYLGLRARTLEGRASR